MNDRLSGRPHDLVEMRKQRRRPGAGGDQHEVGLDGLSVGERNANRA